MAANQWVTAGILTNPTVNDILAESAPQPINGAFSQVFIVFASTAIAGIVLEKRNAANDANIISQVITVPANGTTSIEIPLPIDMATNERLRLKMYAGMVGTCQASMWIR